MSKKRKREYSEEEINTACFSMSVKCVYGFEHLIWAAYEILVNHEVLEKPLYRQYILDKRVIRNYLREQMAAYGHDSTSLFGSNYVEGNIEFKEQYQKAENWVLSRDWSK